MESVQSYEIFDESGFGKVMTLFDDNPTILEECPLCMHVDHKEKFLYDNYIIEFIYDPTTIIMTEENMVVEIFMLLNYLSLC